MGVMKRLYHEKHLKAQPDAIGRRTMASDLVDLATGTTKAERKKPVKKPRKGSGQVQGMLFGDDGD